MELWAYYPALGWEVIDETDSVDQAHLDELMYEYRLTLGCKWTFEWRVS